MVNTIFIKIIENPLFSQLPLAAPDFDENSDFNPEDLIECYEITQEDLDQELGV